MTLKPSCLRATATFLTLAALITACGAPQDAPKPAPIKPVAADDICGGMFGSDTGRDLQQLLTGRKEFYPRTRSEGVRVERVADQMRKEAPGSSKPNYTRASSVCSFLLCKEDVRTRCGGQREIDFYFGWTRHPYFTKEERSEVLNFTVGDAEMTRTVDDLRRATARFACRLPGAHEGAVQGYFQGYWDSDLGVIEANNARLRVLLSAASKVSKSLGCTNNPRLSPSDEIKKSHED
ncbi:hypothetical protein [Streptomyces sp. V3I7]|uniref:hypothetical protein n=1 Tax=Streptomyces sp. V3I7 TaxID=3042278 RepID=UPI0027891DDF|nr:hypothetical protein [Streptomyces sp. V3I7]MDQ0991127.1 hypothetical protein [Streptomyces sp. V3I7]